MEKSKGRRDGEGDELKEEEEEERRKHDGDVERGIGYKCKMASGRTPEKIRGWDGGPAAGDGGASLRQATFWYLPHAAPSSAKLEKPFVEN